MPRPYLSIIVPVHTESEQVPLTLIDLDHDLEGVECAYEIVVAGHSDHQHILDVAERMKRLVKYLKVVAVPESAGVGDIVRCATEEAKGNWRAIISVDYPISIQTFTKQLDSMRDVDVVVASRNEAKNLELPLSRSIGDFTINKLSKLLLHSKIEDVTLEGFQCFSEEAIHLIRPFERLTSAGSHIERTVLADRMGLRVKEMEPIVRNQASAFHPERYLDYFISLLKMRRWFQKNEYGFEPHLKNL